MKQKCYIAGKISNMPEEEYCRLFGQAKTEVEALGYQPISPIELAHAHGKTWNEFMVDDLKEMLDCHLVYAINNWRESKGATIEVNLAITVGKTVIYQS